MIHALPVRGADDRESTYTRTPRSAHTVSVRMPVGARVERHRRGKGCEYLGAALGGTWPGSFPSLVSYHRWNSKRTFKSKLVRASVCECVRVCV